MVLRLCGYGAWIESDGRPLEEHSVEVKDNVISCYVCSEEGKEFALHFDDDGSHSHHLAALFFDHGRVVRVKIDGSEVDRLWGISTMARTSHGMRTGNIIRPYVFAPIDTTDDDIAARDDPTIEHIGTIEVELKRAVRLGDAAVGFQRNEPNTGPIHERSKKAGAHHVVFREGIYRQQNPVDVHYIDNTPWLVFRFLYRKRDMLKAHGILPQSPRASPPAVETPGPSRIVKREENSGTRIKREREESVNLDVIEILSDEDDLGALQDELKRVQDRIARKKAKTSAKVKQEPSVDDVIDLT